MQQTAQKLHSPERRALIAAVRTVIVFAALAFSFAVGWHSASVIPPSILGVQPAEALSSDYKRPVSITVQAGTIEELFACVLPHGSDVADASWVEVKGGEVDFLLQQGGDYKVLAKDSDGYFSEAVEFSVAVDAVTAVTVSRESVYMPLEDTASISYSIETIGDPDTAVSWSSSDESVVTVDESGNLTAIGAGTATVTASSLYGSSAECAVTVSDLYTKTMLSPLKPYVPAYRYTEEEAHLLDEALFYEVEEAGGYGTRAGVVAAVRFLTTQFPYRVPYFFENGRIQHREGRPYCDGEGRFYHKGLYLSTDKYELLEKSVSGPAIWGVDLTNYEDKYHFVRFQRYPNGLDCSGFVTWSIYNGGFDIGDTGAGDFLDSDEDLCDYGERVPLTVALLRSGEVKAGDLIGEDGHIAIVAGIDYENEYIHVAESLAAGVKISSYTFARCPFVGIYEYVCKMDSYYLEDGNYTHMWDDAGDYLAKYYS